MSILHCTGRTKTHPRLFVLHTRLTSVQLSYVDDVLFAKEIICEKSTVFRRVVAFERLTHRSEGLYSSKTETKPSQDRAELAF